MFLFQMLPPCLKPPQQPLSIRTSAMLKKVDAQEGSTSLKLSCFLKNKAKMSATQQASLDKPLLCPFWAEDSGLRRAPEILLMDEVFAPHGQPSLCPQ